MKLRFSPTVFMIVYCVVYIAALATDLPAFRFYPLTGQFNLGPGKLEGIGPAMAWYGIMLDAALAGGLLAVIIPTNWPARVLRNFLWVVPLVAMLACVYLMKGFFR